MSESVAEVVFREASESIEVPAAPVDEVVARSRDLGRRRRRTAVVAVAAGALVVGLGTWAANRPAPQPPEPRATVAQTTNPVDTPWYSDGKLHLEHVTVEVPQVGDLAAVAGGAVYSDDTGVITFAGSRGELTVVGRKFPTVPLAVSGENSWVAWVAPGDAPELVVYSVATEQEVARLGLPRVSQGRGDQPIAIAQDRVFYETDDGYFSWAPPGGVPERLDRDGLIDVDAATRVYDAGQRIDMVQSFFSVSFERPGLGGELSPGGAYVLTTAIRPPHPPVLYDARSGKRLPTGLSGDEATIDAAFGPNHTVHYLVTDRADVGADVDGDTRPLVVLRTCDVGSTDCEDVIALTRPGERPLLAH
jgi:hypothetical protein